MKTKITITDDRPEIRALVETYFKNEYEITSVTNGYELIHSLRSGNMPELIILDIEMPGLDGRSTLKELKTNSFFKHIPVIMLSSLDDSKERISLLTQGADDYMVKPFNPEELKVRIGKILSHRQIQQN